MFWTASLFWFGDNQGINCLPSLLIRTLSPLIRVQLSILNYIPVTLLPNTIVARIASNGGYIQFMRKFSL